MESPATEKQVLWLADLLVTLKQNVTPQMLTEMSSLSRSGIRKRTENVHRLLAEQQGVRYPRVVYAFRTPGTQQTSGAHRRAKIQRAMSNYSREDVILRAACPKCGAIKGSACLSKRRPAGPRKSLHEERWEAFAGV